MSDQSSRLKLIVSYDGTNFSGSQRQSNGRSVQGELEQALARLAGRAIGATFSGRTDRGVHAIGQVVAIPDIRPGMPSERLRIVLNDLLPKDVSVVDVGTVDPAFHPRFDARWREYRYRIWVGGRQPLLDRYAWMVRAPFDLDAARDAAKRVVGTHDLASFAGLGHGVPWSDRQDRPRGTVRHVMRCSVGVVPEWWGGSPDTGSGFELRMVADGFLPTMVRTMAAVMVEIGRGRRNPEWMTELLEVRDRRMGPKTAPPQGLMFWRVGYGEDEPEPDQTP